LGNVKKKVVACTCSLPTSCRDAPQHTLWHGQSQPQPAFAALRLYDPVKSFENIGKFLQNYRSIVPLQKNAEILLPLNHSFMMHTSQMLHCLEAIEQDLQQSVQVSVIC
jgi:hypothetical protein